MKFLIAIYTVSLLVSTAPSVYAEDEFSLPGRPEELQAVKRSHLAKALLALRTRINLYSQVEKMSDVFYRADALKPIRLGVSSDTPAVREAIRAALQVIAVQLLSGSPARIVSEEIRNGKRILQINYLNDGGEFPRIIDYHFRQAYPFEEKVTKAILAFATGANSFDGKTIYEFGRFLDTRTDICTSSGKNVRNLYTVTEKILIADQIVEKWAMADRQGAYELNRTRRGHRFHLDYVKRLWQEKFNDMVPHVLASDDPALRQELQDGLGCSSDCCNLQRLEIIE